jgi:hypothetical protein
VDGATLLTDKSVNDAPSVLRSSTVPSGVNPESRNRNRSVADPVPDVATALTVAAYVPPGTAAIVCVSVPGPSRLMATPVTAGVETCDTGPLGFQDAGTPALQLSKSPFWRMFAAPAWLALNSAAAARTRPAASVAVGSALRMGRES